MHSDPHSQPHTAPRFELAVEGCYSLDDREASANGTLGIVPQRMWVTEQDEQAVSEVFRNVPTEPDYCARRAPLVLRRDLLPVFGVHSARELCRTDHVTEEDRQLSAFARRQRRFRLARVHRDGWRHWDLEPLAATAAELLAGLVGRAARPAQGRRERRAAFRAEPTVGAIVVVTGWAAHRASSRVR
jgi:hypothetical protein